MIVWQSDCETVKQFTKPIIWKSDKLTVLQSDSMTVNKSDRVTVKKSDILMCWHSDNLIFWLFDKLSETVAEFEPKSKHISNYPDLDAAKLAKAEETFNADR